MRVDPKDGRCRGCGGTLTITDADDATMTVDCECGDTYLVETDAFGIVRPGNGPRAPLRLERPLLIGESGETAVLGLDVQQLGQIGVHQNGSSGGGSSRGAALVPG